MSSIAPSDSSSKRKRNPDEYLPQLKMKRQVINQIGTDIDEGNDIKQIRLRNLGFLLLCSCCVLVGMLLLLFGLAITTLFNNRRKNFIAIGVSAIFFIPAMVWMRKCLFPTPFEKEQNNSIRLHIKRHKKMKKKKRFIAQGKDEEYRLDDEYVPDQHVYAPKEEYLPKSIARGNFYDSVVIKQSYDGEMFREVVNYGQDNGYINEYYYRNIIYPEYHTRNEISGDKSVKFLQDDNMENIRVWGGEENIAGPSSSLRKMVNCNDVLRGPWDIYTKSDSSTISLSSKGTLQRGESEGDEILPSLSAKIESAYVKKPSPSPKSVTSQRSIGIGKSPISPRSQRSKIASSPSSRNQAMDKV